MTWKMWSLNFSLFITLMNETNLSSTSIKWIIKEKHFIGFNERKLLSISAYRITSKTQFKNLTRIEKNLLYTTNNLFVMNFLTLFITISLCSIILNANAQSQPQAQSPGKL